MDKKYIDRLCINTDNSILHALKRMDELENKMLLVYSGDNFKGIVSIGDIQRAILKNFELNTPIINILRNDFTFASNHDDFAKVKKIMLSERIELMPVVDDSNNLVDVLFWKDIIPEEDLIMPIPINLPVVIMAGGKGTRLKPLTNVFPKPLIPVGEKSIIETIMDKFVNYGCKDFYLSVNYKAETIKNYFEFLDNKSYVINYFQEDRPLGTAGSLRLLKNQLNTTFFVSNCDILINEDFGKILNYHRSNNNELTVVAAMKNYSIPYGTIETKEDGLLESIEEKPTLSFKINTGFYIVEPSLLKDIPDEFYHITNLMQKLQKDQRRVGVYPIVQNDWIDMGDWEDYLKLIRKL